MNKQPEALRLADALDSKNEIILQVEANRASVELRKLHELIIVLLQKCHVLEKMCGYQPQRKPLTDKQIREIWVEYGCEGEDAEGFTRAIEAAHDIK